MTAVILRTKKLKKTNVALSSAHVTRVIETPNADPRKTHLNVALIGEGRSPDELVKSRVGEVIEARKNAGVKSIRKDAVWAVEFVLTVRDEYWVGKSPAHINSWAQHSLGFLLSRYGAEDIVSATLHLDETSPHIHAYHVPVVRDAHSTATLSAKAFYGSAQKLSLLQDDYAAHMSCFDEVLIRGLKKSRARHKKVREWYSLLEGEVKRETIKLPPLRVNQPPVLFTAGDRKEWAEAESRRIRSELEISARRIMEARAKALYVARQYQLKYKTEYCRTDAYRHIGMAPEELLDWVKNYSQHRNQLNQLSRDSSNFEQLYLEALAELSAAEELVGNYSVLFNELCGGLGVSVSELASYASEICAAVKAKRAWIEISDDLSEHQAAYPGNV